MSVSSTRAGSSEEAAVEVADAFEPSAGSGRVEVHRLEQAADEVVGVSGRGAFLEQLGDEIPGQQVNVLRKEGDEHLEGEALGERALDAALEQAGEERGQFVGG